MLAVASCRGGPGACASWWCRNLSGSSARPFLFCVSSIPTLFCPDSRVESVPTPEWSLSRLQSGGPFTIPAPFFCKIALDICCNLVKLLQIFFYFST